jgi:VWFA-related protein
MLDSRPGGAAPCKAVSRQIVAAFVLLAFVAAPAANGQQNPPPAQSTTTLKISTEVVNVLAIVKDKHGTLIPNLTKNDFSLEEDGKPQDIRYFSRETDTPLTMGILIDTSGSEERMLPLEQEQADAFINQVLRPKDLAFVLHFDLYVELLQDFTSDRARLVRAIDSTRINAGGSGALPGTFPGVSVGGTHLYDAVYLAAHDMLRNEIGRKVIILLTDGEDQGSKETLDAALQSAQKSDVIIYSIATIDRSFYRGAGMGFGGEGVLEKLSNQTGGRMIRASRQKDLAEAFQEIAEELRTQYLLGYTPTNTQRDGSFRKIRVQVRDNHYKVQARRGYYAPSD